MADKSKVGKSEAEVNKELKRLLKRIKDLKNDAGKRDTVFVSPSEDQLIRKIRNETANSPFIWFAEWSGYMRAGDPAYYHVEYTNPDPTSYLMMLSIFFNNLGNLDPDISSAVNGRDACWPYLTSDLLLTNGGEDGSAEIRYTVPYAPSGGHHGVSVLWKADPFSSGYTAFDRGMFWVYLSDTHI